MNLSKSTMFEDRQKDKEKRVNRRAHLTTEEKDAIRQKDKDIT